MNHPDHPDYDPCKMADPLSTCCGSPPLGEVEMGLCSGCRDHCVFEDAAAVDEVVILPPSGPGLSGDTPLVPFGSLGCPSRMRLDIHSRYDVERVMQTLPPSIP